MKSLDKTDLKIISLLAAGWDNRQISTNLRIALSTIQRRTRIIIDNGLVGVNIQPDFKRLGIKKGLLHIYLKNGDIRDTAKQVSNMDGMLSASVHVGNSDVVGDYIYKNGEDLVDTISALKQMPIVDHILWSEEIHSYPASSDRILKSLKRLMGSNGKSLAESGNGNNENGNGKRNPKVARYWLPKKSPH